MLIDYALILSAGMGSRMGEIGKKIPKPLWPIFSKTLLELQVEYCKSLGISHIFINTHFLSAEIEKFLSTNTKFKNVIILHEDPLLDSGGAIHNLASRGDVNYSGNLLMVNADQFLFFDQKYFQDALSRLENSRAALFGIKVNKASKYNETVLLSEQLNEIRKPSGLDDYMTYSGLGLLKLDGLQPIGGPTKFFETVANFKKERVDFLIPEKFEYWDFGTAEVYLESIKRLYQDHKEHRTGWFINFLESHQVFTGNENLFYSEEFASVNLESAGEFEKNCIVGRGIHQKLS